MSPTTPVHPSQWIEILARARAERLIKTGNGQMWDSLTDEQRDRYRTGALADLNAVVPYIVQAVETVTLMTVLDRISPWDQACERVRTLIDEQGL